MSLLAEGEGDDDAYLAIVLNPIRVCAQYKPKFGQGNAGSGLTLEQFRKLYQSDAFYNWFGLDNPLMYAAHKAAGGMTSVYRQIGIGCEKLFRTVIRDSLGLTDTDVTHKSISKTTFFWTILDRPAIKGHEAGRAQL